MWVSGHTVEPDIVAKWLSNGSSLSEADLRDNREAGWFAKRVAEEYRVPGKIRIAIENDKSLHESSSRGTAASALFAKEKDRAYAGHRLHG